MAKALLFKVLNDTIGKYIDGLTEENLKLSVFSGTIALQNVSLNRKGIEELQLPISVVNGFIESINIEIPWTSLESSPVKIFINGVYLLIKPLDFNSYTPEQARKYFNLNKLATISQEEKKIDLQSQVLDSAQEIEVSSGYFDKLTQKIINNLEISLKNIHIRFEDSVSFPSTCFAMGVTLGSFVFTTTDSAWNEKFVSEVNSTNKIQYKLGKISDLGVYWTTAAIPFEEKSFSTWMQTMKAYVYTHSTSAQGTDNYSNLFASSSYLLEPPNTLRAKCIHQPRGTTTDPKLTVTLESITMSFHLDKLQYHQALHLQGVMSEADRRLTFLQYRPAEKPSKAGGTRTRTARQWWQYALMLVVNKEHVLENKVSVCCKLNLSTAV
jgi:vacuolar protein sorting-associated protein 13A/C